ELVGDKRVLTDGVHTIEIYKTQGSNHNEGLLFAYLPKEKVLLEADSFNPPATADAAAPPNPANANLMDNINRLKLDVETIVPVHYRADGRKVSIDELKKAGAAQHGLGVMRRTVVAAAGVVAIALG